MHPSSPTPLEQRKARLLERSAALRTVLVLEASAWQGPLAVADGTLATARWLHTQRWWLLGAGVLVLAMRPRRALRWARHGWWLWRLSRRVQPWVSAWRPRRAATTVSPTAATLRPDRVPAAPVQR